MSRYEELQAALAAEWKADIEYWEKLARKVAMIRIGLYEYLGIETDRMVSIRQVNVPVIAVGKIGGDGKFIHCTKADQVERNGNRLMFCLQLSFAYDLQPPKADQFVFPLALAFVDGQFVLEDVSNVFEPDVFVEPFDTFYEHLLSKVRK